MQQNPRADGLWITIPLLDIERIETARLLSIQIHFGLLDLEANPGDSIPAKSGAYWFRLSEYARGGMPRMVRWPRKKSDQKITANQELALAA